MSTSNSNPSQPHLLHVATGACTSNSNLPLCEQSSFNVGHIQGSGKKSIATSNLTLLSEESSLKSYLTRKFSLNEGILPLDYIYKIKRGILNSVIEMFRLTLSKSHLMYTQRKFWIMLESMVPLSTSKLIKPVKQTLISNKLPINSRTRRKKLI